MNTKTTIGIAIAMTILTLLPTNTANAAKADPRAKYHAILPDAYYDALARCETGGNWKHSTKSYTGGLGIYRGTAHAWSGKRDLSKLTPAEQIEIADRIAFKSWDKPNGERVWRVGVWGWGCVKGQKHLQKFICQSNHRLVIKWKRNC